MSAPGTPHIVLVDDTASAKARDLAPVEPTTPLLNAADVVSFEYCVLSTRSKSAIVPVLCRSSGMRAMPLCTAITRASISGLVFGIPSTTLSGSRVVQRRTNDISATAACPLPETPARPTICPAFNGKGYRFQTRGALPISGVVTLLSRSVMRRARIYADATTGAGIASSSHHHRGQARVCRCLLSGHRRPFCRAATRRRGRRSP